MKFRNSLEFDESKIVGFKLDSDFCGRLPALPEEDFLGLQRDVLKDGLRDNIIVWKEKNVLVDGYHRLWICLQDKISYENKIHYQSFATRNDAILWMLRNQIHRRGGLTLYLRILLALGAEPALKDEGERLIKEAGKKGKPIDFKRDEGLPDSGKPFNKQKELCKLAGTNSYTTIDMVRFTEKCRKKGYWNDVIEALDDELKRGINHSITVHGDVYQVSIATLHRHVKNLVDVDEAVKEGILTKKIDKVKALEDKIAFLKAVKSASEEATLEGQEEVLKECGAGDFSTYDIGVLLTEVIKQKQEETEEKEEEEEKKDVPEDEKRKKEMRIKKDHIEKKILNKLTKVFDANCESVKELNLELTTLFRLVEKYKLDKEEFMIDEKTTFEFQRASFRLVGYLKDIFEKGIKEERQDKLLLEGKI